MTLDDLGPRIIILGPSNSGKSTLAEAIARARGLEAIHLDQLHHQPGTDWVQRPPEEAQTGPGEQRPVEIEHRQPAVMIRKPRGTFRRTGGGDVVSIDVDPGAHGSTMRGGAVRFVNTVGRGR